MIPFFIKHGIQILTYGTLLGGFFSEKYLNTDEPTRVDLTTASLQKYKNMIDVWGGWELFQELLVVLNNIAEKHDCSIANIATKFILDKPLVAGVIIGARLGITNHIEENSKIFDLKLDQDDISLISTITSKSNDLFDEIGDCGDEYR
jgi:aryl-alcohol dehydrogenase-like predicted oxidoreductase